MKVYIVLYEMMYNDKKYFSYTRLYYTNIYLLLYIVNKNVLYINKYCNYTRRCIITTNIVIIYFLI